MSRFFSKTVKNRLSRFLADQAVDRQGLPRRCRNRPHQGIGIIVFLEPPDPVEQVPALGEVRCKSSLGGLLKSYSRVAA